VRSPNPHHLAVVTVQTSEPDLVGAAFEMIHTIAKAHDLPDVAHIDIEMKVTFEGSTHPLRAERFKAQINRMWTARVTHFETVEPTPVEPETTA
jgi:hypothetical protein